jgi:peptidyl-prolyl cis-trans isomerase B (cyclophilin B)
MIKHVLVSFLVLLTLTRCGKKENTSIAANRIREELLAYGKANPENRVIIDTDFGTIKLKLYDDTPLHRANFVKLIKEDHYRYADFYRIVYQFMIQGGDQHAKKSYTIPAEITPDHIHKKGALSMARYEENNPQMESSGSEFFIVQGNVYDPVDLEDEARELGVTLTPLQRSTYTTIGGYMTLDMKYTVFGEVTEGQEVVDKIAGQKVFEGDKPLYKIPFRIRVEQGE